MARIRTVKPSFFTSLTVADLSVEARLTFIGLWTYVDDEGRGVDDPRLVRAAVWPLDDHRLDDVAGWLDELAEAGLIRRYTVDGRRFLVIHSWLEHQKVSHPAPSTLPPPPEHAEPVEMAADQARNDSPEVLQSPPENLRNVPEPLRPERKGREGKGKEPPLPPRSAPEPSGTGGNEAARVTDALEQLLAEDRARAPGNTGPGWDVAVSRRLRADHGNQLVELAVAHPDWTPAQLAAAARPPTQPATRPADPPMAAFHRLDADAVQAAAAALVDPAELDPPWLTDTPRPNLRPVP